jgi:hypothetical protein
VQVRRDGHLIQRLLVGVRACGAFQSLLLCTDGLSSYPKQALKVLREPIRSGKRGDGLGFFCRRGSWLPRRSSATLGDG